MSQLPPAPEAIKHLTKCGCAKTRCSANHCQGKKAGLTCTDLSKCTESDDASKNSNTAEDLKDEDDDDSI